MSARRPLTIDQAVKRIRERTNAAKRTISEATFNRAIAMATDLGVVAVTTYIVCDGLEGLRKSQADNGFRPSLYYRDGVARAGGDAAHALAAAIVCEANGIEHWQA